MPTTKITVTRNEAIHGMFGAADILSNNVTKKIKNTLNGHDFGVYQSAIILRAISIELALKSILDEESGTYERTHSSKSLFLSLESNIKAEIERQYEEKTRSNLEWLSLGDLLDQVSNIFVEWRYATFDGNHLNIKTDSWDYFGSLLKEKLSG